MMKICPECLNLNVNSETCSACGYPLSKKVIGRFEEYLFYDAIELFNAGDFQRAKEKIAENQKPEFSNKNALLLDKIQSAEALMAKAESNASLAKDYLLRKEYSLAADAIRASIAIYPSAKYKDIELQIAKGLEFTKRTDKANSLFNDAQLLFKNGSYTNALSTMRQAMELDPSNETFKNTYKQLSDETAKVWCKEVEQLVASKKINEASVVLDEALIYAGSNNELLQWKQKVTELMNKKKNARFLITSVIVLIILGAGVFGFMKWDASSKEKTEWEYALSEGTIPALEDYIKLHPQSQYIPEAQEKLSQIIMTDSLDWNTALLARSKSGINDYLTKAQAVKGRYLTRATEMIDSIEWFEIEKLDDAALFNSYIATHPNSKYLADAQARLSLTVNDSEKMDMYNMMVSYFNSYQQKDLETIMQYYNPITSLYGSRNNITKADLRLLFEKDLSTVSAATYTLDYATFKATKDANGNYYLKFFADINLTRINNTQDPNEGELVSETNYFTNSEYTVVIDQTRKINKLTYTIISEQPIN